MTRRSTGLVEGDDTVAAASACLLAALIGSLVLTACDRYQGWIQAGESVDVDADGIPDVRQRDT